MIDLLASAWLSITRHRLRSLLAMAGVAVGVCALTSIVSVEQSWRRAVTGFFASMDLETVRVGVPGGADWREAGLKRGELDAGDVEAIRRQPAVVSATVMTWRTLRAEAEGGEALEVTARAVGADFTQTLPDEVKEGRLLTAAEVAAQAPVCVLSFEARVWLFGNGKALGRKVRLEGRPFAVVGVIAGNRHSGIGPRAVYLPNTWRRAVLRADPHRAPTTECFVHTRDPQAAAGQIEHVLRERLGGDGARPFAHSLWEVRAAARHARSRATGYSGLAGLCALLAASIGIASVLFVSVAERSREIGVHRALGASRAHIYREHLLAAVLLAAGGGVLGALAGIPSAAAGAFSARWQPVLDPMAGEYLTEGGRQLPRLSEIALSVSWEATAIAVLLAVLTGAAAALAPASEAAALSPAPAMAQRPAATRGARRALTCLQVAFGMMVLVVLTSYFALLDSEEKAEARRSLGQDRVSAIADPIAALRKPVDPRYVEQCRDALVTAVTPPEARARLVKQTPLLTGLVPVAPLWLGVSGGARTLDQVHVFFTTGEQFTYRPELTGEALRRVRRAFDAGEAVVVLNPEAQAELFPRRDPIGQKLSLAGKPFRVIAVRPSSAGGEGGPEVYAPLSFFGSLKHRAQHGGIADTMSEARISARPIDERRYVEALAQLRAALLPMLPAEYRKGIKLSQDIPETTKQFIFQGKSAAIRGAVGALAVLLVALIGLANMLLVSVHDELRETGVRRALGATRPDVFLHFVQQGVLQSALGAAVGLVLGGAVCWATRSWVGAPLSVSVFWAVAGAVATVLAGLVTSVGPALLAARISPAEALRYE